MDDQDNQDRDDILRRRSRFVAIALASMTTACGSPDAEPRPCLSPIPEQTEEEDPDQTPPPESEEPQEVPLETVPQVCLMFAPVEDE